MSEFPNQRGKAKRSGERNVRYETHKPVLQACIEELGSGPFFAIEHGMGLGSTPFFHTHPNVTIVSFEREKEWAWCSNCNSGSLEPHSIVITYDKQVSEQVKQGFDPPRTVGLVDGFAAHRIVVLEQWMSQSIPFIVEHDAETMKGHQVRTRRALAFSTSYTAYQYVALNPESIVYVHSSKHLSLTGSCVPL